MKEFTLYAQTVQLKPLTDITLSKEDSAILAWIRSAQWELVKDAKSPQPFKAKVPEFYKGARLYQMHAGPGGSAAQGIELFVKKLGIQGIISKQALYPLSGHGNQPRYLTLAKADLDNLGVGKDEEDEE